MKKEERRRGKKESRRHQATPDFGRLDLSSVRVESEQRRRCLDGLREVEVADKKSLYSSVQISKHFSMRNLTASVFFPISSMSRFGSPLVIIVGAKTTARL